MFPRLAPLAALSLLTSCAFFDLEFDDDGDLIATFESEELPLLPPGFPVYPKAFSTESLGLAIEETLFSFTMEDAIDAVAGDICAFGICLSDLLSGADYDALDDALFDELPEVQEWLEQFVIGRLRFYDPGPLSLGVSEQIGRTLQGAPVTFDEVELHLTVRNRTEEMWAVPIAFTLYMGNAEQVISREAKVLANPDDPYTFFLEPGETKEIVVQAPGLVDALNDFHSVAIDYDADIEVFAIDPNSFADWIQASPFDGDGNGIADDLASWGLVFEDFHIVVSGHGEIDLPIDTPEWLNQYL